MRFTENTIIEYYIYFAHFRHHTCLHSPGDALLSKIYIEILILFFLWNVTKFPCFKCYIKKIKRTKSYILQKELAFFYGPSIILCLFEMECIPQILNTHYKPTIYLRKRLFTSKRREFIKQTLVTCFGIDN